jgi:hypothetical protein
MLDIPTCLAALTFAVAPQANAASPAEDTEVRRRQLLDRQEAHVVLADRLEATVHGERVVDRLRIEGRVM